MTKLRACNFSFDVGPAFAGLTDGSHWSGFLNVWVSPETRAAITNDPEIFKGDDEGRADLLALPVEDSLVCLGWRYATMESEDA
jgi:hypothetical protein